MSTPASAKDQVARLLTLVPYLHARGQVQLDEAAAALGVSTAQLLKDLKVLLMCGLPGGYPDDLIDVDLDALEGPDADGLIRVSNADYLARPLRLTPTEATALIVALRALRAGAGDQTREVVDRALAKLEAAAAEGAAAPRVDPGADAADTDRALLATRLQRAADRRRQVRLSYYVPSRDEQSERVVDPLGVVNAGGHAYLDAWCHSAEAPRLFRLDRIDSADVLDAPIETTPAAPRDLADGFFARDTDVTTATLLLEPAARWVTEYYPVEDVRPRPDGRVEVDLLVADERWLTRLLLSLAPHARILEPPAYVDTFLAAAQERWTFTDDQGRTMGDDRIPYVRTDMAPLVIGGLGTTELLIILAVLVLLFGATKLPELARGSGRALRIFKAETKGLMDDEEDESTKTAEQLQIEAQQTDLAQRQAALDAEAERLRRGENA